MLLTSYLQHHLLLAAALLTPTALARFATPQQLPPPPEARADGIIPFTFPGCVSDCVGGSGCGTNNAQCMCKAARGNLLEAVVTCMSKHCTAQLGTVKPDFLDIMVRDCVPEKLTIPYGKVKAAQDLAGQLSGGNAPGTTGSSAPAAASTPLAKPVSSAPAAQQTPSTTRAPAVAVAATPTPSSSAAAAAETTAGEAGASASEDGPAKTTSEEAAASSTEAEEAAAATTETLAKAPTSKSAVKTTSEKETTTRNLRTDPTDSTPFAAQPDSMAGRGAVAIVGLWAVAPLVVAAAVVLV